MTANNVNWWMPSPLQHSAMSTVGSYFARRLFLWMPRKMWGMALVCPRCTDERQPLRSKGVYHKVRRVMDVIDMYYLAATYMGCRRCGGMG